MRTDFFNEAIVTSMLAASSAGEEEESPDARGAEEDLTRADTLRERLVALLERADRAAAAAGVPKDHVATADFAVCAFIDEILLSSSSWPGRGDWMTKPLQFVRHGTATAGEDFYRILDSLLEEAEKKTAPARSQDAGTRPFPEEDDARDPLRVVLEIFALCLAQGFTGMLYGDARGIRDKLEKIGGILPAVARCDASFPSVPEEKDKGRRPLRAITDLFRRFDPLDWYLWLIPPALTVLLYRMCETRLDRLLQPLLQGSAP